MHCGVYEPPVLDAPRGHGCAFWIPGNLGPLLGGRDGVGRIGESVSELPPLCVVRLHLVCSAPIGRDASQVLTDRADVRTEWESVLPGVCGSGCCGVQCDPPRRGLARDVCVLVLFCLCPRQTEFQSPPCHLPAVCLGAGDCTCLCLSFLICTIGMIKIPVSEGCCKD